MIKSIHEIKVGLVLQKMSMKAWSENSRVPNRHARAGSSVKGDEIFMLWKAGQDKGTTQCCDLQRKPERGLVVRLGLALSDV